MNIQCIVVVFCLDIDLRVKTKDNLYLVNSIQEIACSTDLIVMFCLQCQIYINSANNNIRSTVLIFNAA